MKKLTAAAIATIAALSLAGCNTPEDRALGGAGLGALNRGGGGHRPADHAVIVGDIVAQDRGIGDETVHVDVEHAQRHQAGSAGVIFQARLDIVGAPGVELRIAGRRRGVRLEDLRRRVDRIIDVEATAPLIEVQQGHRLGV